MNISDKSEILKTFTDNGTFIGYKDRETVHNELLLHDEIALWIIRPSDKSVLLERRSPFKKLNANKWALCAGHVVMDETLDEALYKEAYEELGLDLKLYSPQKLVTVIRNEYCNYSCFHQYCIVADVPIEAYKIQEEELSGVNYFRYEDLKQRVKSGDVGFAIVWNKTYKQIFDVIDKIIESI